MTKNYKKSLLFILVFQLAQNLHLQLPQVYVQLLFFLHWCQAAFVSDLGPDGVHAVSLKRSLAADFLIGGRLFLKVVKAASSFSIVGFTECKAFSRIPFVSPWAYFRFLPLFQVVFASVFANKHIHLLLLFLQQFAQRP